MSENSRRKTDSPRASAPARPSRSDRPTTTQRATSSKTRSANKRTYPTAAAVTTARPTAPPRHAPTSVRSRVTDIAAQWDYPLLTILAILLISGLVMVFSATLARFGVSYFLKQLIWAGLGLVALIFMARAPYRWWQQMAIPIMIVALTGLVAVLLFGEDRFGARRTFFGSIQPSEFAKLAMVIYVSAWVASSGRQLSDVRGGLIPFAILMGLVTSLIVLEPSFSVAIVILAIGIAIFFIGGADIKQLLVVGAIGLLMLALLLWQSPHALERIQGWLGMLSDPTLAPENVRRAIELMRHGGGLLPDAEVWGKKVSVSLLWSDYLFANIGADLGLVGQSAVIVLFAALGYRGLGIALNAPDRFSGLVAIGITTWLLSQATIHIGTSLALIPATGQPLPFMSYGGSSMVSCMAGIGLLLGIAHASPEKKSVYESFAFRGRDRRSRVSDSGRSGRAVEGRRTTDDGRTSGTRPRR